MRLTPNDDNPHERGSGDSWQENDVKVEATRMLAGLPTEAVA